MKEVAFDRVVVAELTGPRRLSPQEFLAIPIHTRVRMILKRQLEFFLGDRPVDYTTALRFLLEFSVRDKKGAPKSST